MKSLMIFALALGLAVPAAGMAAAAETSVPMVKVRYGDLDLTKAHDASLMVRRMDNAAASACGASQFSLREVQKAVRESDCYRQSMDRAMADLGSPMVNAAYRARGVAVASN